MKLDIDRADAVVRKIVARYTKRCWWARKPDVQDDLHQHGWVVVMQALKTWDPKVGIPFDGYLEKALIRSLPEVLWKLSSPASASKGDRKELRTALHAPITEYGGAKREAVETDPQVSTSFDKYEREHQGSWSDALIDDKEWHCRARRALAAIMGEGDAQVRTGIAFELEKLDGHDGNPGLKSEEYAQALGVPKQRIYGAAFAAKARLKQSKALRDLIRERGK